MIGSTGDKMETYTCPVCGYDKLEDSPAKYEICPCCGTEFENDDFEHTHAELRKFWIDGGMKWWSENDLPPVGWDPTQQLEKFEDDSNRR